MGNMGRSLVLVVLVVIVSACDSEVESLHVEPGCNPFATSRDCVLPYPSAFFQVPDPTSPTGVRVKYPDNTLPLGENGSHFDIGPTNTADGVSPAGPLLVHFGVDVHSKHLTSTSEAAESLSEKNTIALFNHETGQRVPFSSEMDMNRDSGRTNRYALIVRPIEPLATGKRHVAVLTRELTDASGKPLESPRAFVALRDRIPTDNAQVESVREHYEGLFAFLESHGYPRKNLLLAWDFMVASEEHLLGSVLSMREEALRVVARGDLGYRITQVVDDPNEHLARIVEGDFEVPSYLNEKSDIVFDSAHRPVRQEKNAWYPFTMIIPKKARESSASLPLVIFGHGIFGKGRKYLTSGGEARAIHAMAEKTGAVVVATDWIGLSGGDREQIIANVIPNLDRISLITDRLQQSLINNLVLTELALGPMARDNAIRTGTYDLVDASRVFYYGVSLGGIQGASLISLSNRIVRGVLAVPGAVWLNMIPRSIHWISIKSVLDTYYPDPIVQQLGIALAQTRFDLSDPLNLTKLMFKRPLPDAPPDRKVILQEAIGDSQVPNMATEMLARAIGIRAMAPLIEDIFGLETVTSPSSESVLVQYHLAEDIAGNYPPRTNVPPETDNGAHYRMPFRANVLEQVSHFMETGEVSLFCEGACDPD
ncbi:MAG: hypothetical protein HY698_00725 [Deltaproteobacteria bacterium]|nr:hypothetical protein [Deltaproteobacteria bacterium]